MSSLDVPRSGLRAADLAPMALSGLHSRRVRSALSMLGIAIGIAAITGVLGVVRSSQSDLLAKLDRLGTSLLTVTAGRTPGGQPAALPATAAATVARADGVTAVTPTADLNNVKIYRTDQVPAYRSSGLTARAADITLLSTLDGHVASGVFLNEATERYPVTVLGHEAARQLGIATAGNSTRIWLGQHWFLVIGILEPLELAPEIDQSALVGFPTAADQLDYRGSPNRIYIRTAPAQTATTALLLARVANPRNPETVTVSRPSDVLTARLAVADTGTGLYLGLGAIALLVGGIGIGNVMVVSVLERRGEIGLRRALGAARRHVAAQFLAESLLLGTLGGLAGLLLGTVATFALAAQRNWTPLLPASAIWIALGASVVIGAIAGVYPAHRAARLSPVQALRSM